MSSKSSRASQVGRAARLRRAAAAVILAAGLSLTGAACGMDVQTTQAYTPGEGINVDVVKSDDPQVIAHVRNLLIISHAPGEGVLSASILAEQRDSLTAVTGNAIKVDGAEGAPLVVELGGAVELPQDRLVVLTDRQPLITVKSADLLPGLYAVVTVRLSASGETTVRIPVVDGAAEQYRTITPSPVPSASPSPAP